VPRRTVIFKHAFRNALLPLVSVVAIDAGALFGGLVITEQIFSIQGMGKVFLDALNAGDAQVLVVWLLVTSAFVILFNLIADLTYGVLDPRVRLT
jgi:peptide/nickel transport system permease protein